MQVQRSGRMLGCPPAGSETSMASRAWAWCAARSRTQFHHEEYVLVGYSKGDLSVNVRFSKDVDGNCALEVRLRRPTLGPHQLLLRMKRHPPSGGQVWFRTSVRTRTA